MVVIRCTLLSLLFSALAFALIPSVVKYDSQLSLGAPQKSHVTCPRQNPYVKDGTLIDQLWRNNCDVVDRFLHNAFCLGQATQNGTGLLESFQYYSVQDYYYLLNTVPFDTFLLTTDGPTSPEDTRSDISWVIGRMNKSLGYADEFYQDITSKLNISTSVIDNGIFEAAGLGYVNWLRGSVGLGWFAYEVSRIACIYGWAEIANNLNSSINLDTNSAFYKEWIEVNLGWDYGARHSEKLESELQFYNNSKTFETYNRLFREGMLFEIDFFNSAIGRKLEQAAKAV
ncbi:hypothetical protein M434DRAFT_398311 [Hypoxylon sp. CO27-5]|nr:hypothetical protein M434DRAFT_398311 [Hypoxylon sp. CO27-5]